MCNFKKYLNGLWHLVSKEKKNKEKKLMNSLSIFKIVVKIGYHVKNYFWEWVFQLTVITFETFDVSNNDDDDDNDHGGDQFINVISLWHTAKSPLVFMNWILIFLYILCYNKPFIYLFTLQQLEIIIYTFMKMLSPVLYIL